MATPPPTTKQACQGHKADGTPCGAAAQAGKRWCFMHDPTRQVAAAAARRAGGIARNKPAPAAPIDLSTPEAQRRAIEETIDRVRAGHESVNVGKLVLYGISIVRGITDMEELVARLEALEEARNAELQATIAHPRIRP
jgi:hypothetical protein